MIRVTDTIALDADEVSVTFVRSGGPGGQNVNKVATAAQLRFDAANSRNLPEPVRQRLLRLAGSRATTSGEIVISADRFRTQEANRRDAIARLVDLIARASERPKPRIATRPGAGAVRRRIDGKKRRSEVKQGRSRVRRED